MPLFFKSSENIACKIHEKSGLTASYENKDKEGAQLKRRLYLKSAYTAVRGLRLFYNTLKQGTYAF